MRRLLLILTLAITSCLPPEELEINKTAIKLERIQTIFRYKGDVAYLHWREIEREGKSFIQIIEIEDTINYTVGMKSYLMIKR